MRAVADISRLAFSGLFLLGLAITIVIAAPRHVAAQDAAGDVYVEHSGPRPNNAVITSKGWRCRDGFALAGSGRCEAVKAPANAIVIGNSWRCMPICAEGYILCAAESARLRPDPGRPHQMPGRVPSCRGWPWSP